MPWMSPLRRLKHNRYVICCNSQKYFEGKLENCAGTNALERLGFIIIYSDGTIVEPEGQGNSAEAQPKTESKVLAISLIHAARLDHNKQQWLK